MGSVAVPASQYYAVLIINRSTLISLARALTRGRPGKVGGGTLVVGLGKARGPSSGLSGWIMISDPCYIPRYLGRYTMYVHACPGGCMT